MEGFKESITGLKENAGKLIDNYVKLAKAQATEKSSTILSMLIVIVLSLFLLIFILFFSGMALGIWLGNLLNNPVAGYLIVTGVYILLLVIVVAARNKIILPFVSKSIIKKIYG